MLATLVVRRVTRAVFRGRRADLLVVAVGVALVAVAAVVGVLLTDRGVRLYVDAPPLYARWQPHAGIGTPLAVAVAAATVYWGPRWAARLSWPRVLGAGYLAALAWTLSLALVDGWSGGLATRLTPPGEYLDSVRHVTDIPAMIERFAGGILDFTDHSWPTHVAGHPPGALLVFVVLDRLGLGGGGPAALACALIGSTVAISVPVTLRALRDEAAARAALPFVVLFPGAVWIGASADGVFTGVVAAGLALLAVRGPVAVTGLAGGILLGFALYLSYGLVLVAPLALAVVAMRRRQPAGVLVAAAAGAGAVVVTFTVAGFWWLDGYHLVVQRYYQGWAADRPYTYWVWANLACVVLAAGPVVGPAFLRAWRPGGPVRALAAAAALAVVVADLSGLSKAEVERIWLPYTVWLLVATARLPDGDRRAWLTVQATTALAVNHLLWTNW